MCVSLKTLLVEIFFSWYAPIKFDKLTFYGQNTWFSLVWLLKKSATEATTKYITNCRKKGTNGTEILLRFSYLISFFTIFFFFFTNVGPLLTYIFLFVVLILSVRVMFDRNMQCAPMLASGRMKSTQSHIQYATNTYGSVNFVSRRKWAATHLPCNNKDYEAFLVRFSFHFIHYHSFNSPRLCIAFYDFFRCFPPAPASSLFHFVLDYSGLVFCSPIFSGVVHNFWPISLFRMRVPYGFFVISSHNLIVDKYALVNVHSIAFYTW